jgi:hypothetical protein
VVEHNLAKVGVASSNLVSRSKIWKPRYFRGFYILQHGNSKINTLAEWQSGYAAVCKTVYLGSIPGSASNFSMLHHAFARVAELVDARDLKSLALTGVPVRFRPRAPF